LGKKLLNRLAIIEAAGFGLVLIALWADEIFDLPHHIFGSVATPINWLEAAAESLYVIILGGVTFLLTGILTRRLKYLEGFIVLCSFCKKVRVGEDWIPIEEYIQEHSEADFSHGLCDSCARDYYGYDPASGSFTERRRQSRNK
jgi:hypothetical protein